MRNPVPSALGWRVLDRRTMTAHLQRDLEAGGNALRVGWRDDGHFQAYVSAEFNNLLMAGMCTP